MIRCPVCERESHHPVDEETGWCSACERFTGKTYAEVEAGAEAIRARGDVGVAESVLHRLRKHGAKESDTNPSHTRRPE